MLSLLRQVEEHPGETLLHEWLPGEKEQWLAEARFLIAYYHLRYFVNTVLYPSLQSINLRTLRLPSSVEDVILTIV